MGLTRRTVDHAQADQADRADRWKQLNDETLTEVMAIASIPGIPGVVAGSPYGIATGRVDALGAVRWTHHSDALRVNERFTNAILVHPGDPSTWLIGTEGGVLIADGNGAVLEKDLIVGHGRPCPGFLSRDLLGRHRRPGYLA